MSTEKLAHEASGIYAAALRAYRALAEKTQPESRVLSGALRTNAQRLLAHAACAGGLPSCAAQQRSLRYARIAVLKLFATLDAAWCERQVSNDERENLRALLGQALALTEPAHINASTTMDAPSPEAEQASLPRQDNFPSDRVSNDFPSHDREHFVENHRLIPAGVPIEFEKEHDLDDDVLSLWIRRVPVGSS